MLDNDDSTEAKKTTPDQPPEQGPVTFDPEDEKTSEGLTEYELWQTFSELVTLILKTDKADKKKRSLAANAIPLVGELLQRRIVERTGERDPSLAETVKMFEKPNRESPSDTALPPLEERQELVVVLNAMDCACIRRALLARHQAVNEASHGSPAAKAELLGYLDHALNAIDAARSLSLGERMSDRFAAMLRQMGGQQKSAIDVTGPGPDAEPSPEQGSGDGSSFEEMEDRRNDTVADGGDRGQETAEEMRLRVAGFAGVARKLILLALSKASDRSFSSAEEEMDRARHVLDEALAVIEEASDQGAGDELRGAALVLGAISRAVRGDGRGMHIGTFRQVTSALEFIAGNASVSDLDANAIRGKINRAMFPAGQTAELPPFPPQGWLALSDRGLIDCDPEDEENRHDSELFYLKILYRARRQICGRHWEPQVGGMYRQVEALRQHRRALAGTMPLTPAGQLHLRRQLATFAVYLVGS